MWIAAIIGFILSLIALRREPRGFAIAGAVIGGLVVLFWVSITVLVTVIGLGAVLAGVGLLAFLPAEPQTQLEMGLISIQVGIYAEQNGALPPDLQTLNLGVDRLNDAWGNPYRYEVVGVDSFSIGSAGPDGEFDTADDLSFDDITRNP